MNDVNRFLEEGIIQAIRNLLPVKSILRDSLQEDDDDLQVTTTPAVEDDVHLPVEMATPGDLTASLEMATPVEIVTPGELTTPVEIPTSVPADALDTSDNKLSADTILKNVSEIPLDLGSQGSSDVKIITATKPPSVVSVEKQNTLVVETEKSVGFTGIDSVYGTVGDAELRPMVDEGSDEFKILGDSEELDINDIEDLDSMDAIVPLAADDYEDLHF